MQQNIPGIFKNQIVRDIGLSLIVACPVTLIDEFLPPQNIASYILLIVLAFTLLIPFLFAHHSLLQRYGERIYIWRWFVITPLFLVVLVLSLLLPRTHRYDYPPVVIPIIISLVAFVWSLIEKAGTFLGLWTGVKALRTPTNPLQQLQRSVRKAKVW